MVANRNREHPSRLSADYIRQLQTKGLEYLRGNRSNCPVMGTIHYSHRTQFPEQLPIRFIQADPNDVPDIEQCACDTPFARAERSFAVSPAPSRFS